MRYFCEIVSLDKGTRWGLNILSVDGEKRICQRTTDGSSQEAELEGFSYQEGVLRFTPRGGKTEELRIGEVKPDLICSIQRPTNWDNLLYGLRIRSEKTLKWLLSRGVTKKGQDVKVREENTVQAAQTFTAYKTHLFGAKGKPVPGIRAVCNKCGHGVEVYGQEERSVRRCGVLLAEACPMAERNFYTIQGELQEDTVRTAEFDDILCDLECFDP